MTGKIISKESKILVVDDRAINRKTAKAAFEEIGMKVTLVENYTQFRVKMVQQPPDIVVSDLFFPSGDSDISTKLMFSSELRVGLSHVDTLNDKMRYNASRWNKLKEEPSGLLVLLDCLKAKIPVTVISQGERHHNQLAIVRDATRVMKTFREINLCEVHDPFPEFLTGLGVMKIDKKDVNSWLLSLIEYLPCGSFSKKPVHERSGILYDLDPEFEKILSELKQRVFESVKYH